MKELLLIALFILCAALNLALAHVGFWHSILICVFVGLANTFALDLWRSKRKRPHHPQPSREKGQ